MRNAYKEGIAPGWISRATISSCSERREIFDQIFIQDFDNTLFFLKCLEIYRTRLDATRDKIYLSSEC